MIDIVDDDVPKSVSDGDTIFLYQTAKEDPIKVIGPEITGEIIEIDDNIIEFECINLIKSLLSDTKLEKAYFKVKFRKEKNSFAMEQEALTNLSTKIIKQVLFPEKIKAEINDEVNLIDMLLGALNLKGRGSQKTKEYYYD